MLFYTLFIDFQTKILEEKLLSMDTLSLTLKRKCEDYFEEVKKLKRDVSNET